MRRLRMASSIGMAAVVTGDTQALVAQKRDGGGIGDGVPGVLDGLALLLGADHEVGRSDAEAVAGGDEEFAGDIGPGAVGSDEIVKIIVEQVAGLEGDELVVTAGDLKDIAVEHGPLIDVRAGGE